MRTCMITLSLLLSLLCTLLAFSQPPGENSDDEKERIASERFLTVLEKNPRRGTAFDRVYGYHVERGTLDQLLKKFKDRTEKDAKDGLAWMIIGLVEAQRGKDAAAVKAFQQAEAVRTDDPLAAYYLGQVLILVGQPDKAAEALERAIARKPARTDMLDIFQTLGRVYQRGQNAEQALTVWKRLDKLFPDDQRVLEQIATVLIEEGQFAQALPRLESLAKISTDAYRKVSLQMEAADLKVRLGQSDKALLDLETILSNLEPESWLFREARRRIEEVFLRSDDQAGLAKYYEAWLKKKADDVDAMGRLAKTLATLGRTADARHWLDEALKKAPSRKDLRLALIEQLAFEQKFAEAGKQYEALDQNEPNNPDVLREWGKLLLKDTTKPEAERKQGAVAVWKRLIDRRPNDALTATQVADLFRQANLQDESLSLYRKAVELAPDSGQYREYLGEYLHSLKKPDEALVVWRGMAEGKQRNAKNLARLAEVLASFSYPAEAIKTLGDASTLDKTDFALQLRYGEMLAQNEKYDDALKQYDVVAALSKNDEEKDAVLMGRIRCRQGQDKLGEVAELLTKSLEKDANQAEKWYELSRYREALRDMPEAMKAAQQAVKLASKQVLYLATLARLQETAGNMLDAAESYRQLASLDRKNKPEYLINVAKLESRLGRREPALTAGKDLLAAAPGNAEHHKFYADLCFQLGNEEEGLEALRRAVRANPGEPNVINNLAGALSERFRTGEAIELYWRAFTKANDVEARNSIVTRLSDLYLQTNQFDKLLERLERERREPGRQRDFTFCVAQAHQSAGDFGAARRELESLLSTNPRDAVVLQQLATLAESENDDNAALKYLRQLSQTASVKDIDEKLARVLDRLGQSEEAQSIYARLALAEQDQIKILTSVDRLIQNEKPEVALEVLGKVRREGSATWEALYREGVALVNLKRPAEAEARFRSLLALKNNDDELSMAASAAQAKLNKSSNTPVQRRGMIPPQTRYYSYSQVQYATGLISREYYGGMNPRQWTPSDYGSARIASLAWMFQMAKKNSQEDAFVKAYRTAFDAAVKQTVPEPQPLWDWFHLTTFRSDEKDRLEASEQLARLQSPNALWTSLQKYNERRQNEFNRRNQGTGKRTPPKAADLDKAVAAYRQLARTQPSYASSHLTTLLADMDLAKRDKESDEIYQSLRKSASKPEELQQLLSIAASRSDLPVVFQTADTLRKMPTRGQMYAGLLSNALVSSMVKLVESKDISKFPGIIDYQLQTWCIERREKPTTSTRQRTANAGRGGMNFQIMTGKPNTRNYINLEYPEANSLLDFDSINVLRNAFEAYKDADLVSDLVTHLNKAQTNAPVSDKAVYQMALSAMAWWMGDKPLALQHLTAVCQLEPGSAELQLDLADMNIRMMNFEDAMTSIENVVPLDQQTTTRKEELALSVAQRLGNLDRARLAAQRLFGLRLDADAQARLAKTMQALAMHDLAEAVLARARRQAGNKTNALTSLMQQFASQGKNEVSLQIAYQLLRKTPPPTRMNYYVQGDEEMRSARAMAVQVLSRSGKLNELIARSESQLKSAPNSVALWRTLIEYYQAAGAKEKVRDAVEKLAKLRPEDTQLRMQVAQLYREMGDFKRCCEEYLQVFKKDPQLFANRYWEVEQIFNQANEGEKLIKFIEEVDLKALGQPYVISNLLTQQLQNEKTRDAGLRLFKRAWVAFKDQRQNLISNLYDEQVWALPEIFDYVLEGLLPEKGVPLRDPWGNVSQVISYYQDGRLITYLSRCLDMGNKQSRLDELGKKIDESIAAQPKWLGGYVAKAALLARLGQSDEAAKIIKMLIDNKEDELPVSVKRTLAQEMEQQASTHNLAIMLYQSSKGQSIENWGYSPELDVEPRLAKLFIEVGRKNEARTLLMRAAKSENNNSPYDSEYRDYQRMQQLSQAATQLASMGFTVDAAKLYSDMLSDPQKLESVRRYYGGNFRSQIEMGLNHALSTLDEEGIQAALMELLTPTLDSKTNLSGNVKPNAIDPIILANVKDLEKSSISSVYSLILDKISQEDKGEAIRTRLSQLRKEYPDDYSVAVLEVIFELSRTKADQPASDVAVESVNRLIKFVEAHPLETLSAGVAPNARQRSEASKQIVVWLAARAALVHPNLRPQGAVLAEKALAIARRMKSEEHLLAILKEWSQFELKAGNKAAAEERYREILKLIFAPSKSGKQAQRPTAATATGVAIPATSVVRPGPSLQPLAATAAVPMKSAPGLQGRVVSPGRPGSTASRIDVVTTEQALKAFSLARLAAEEGMLDLSVQAVEQAIKSGPPVQLTDISMNTRSRRIMTSSGMVIDEQTPSALNLEAELPRLCLLWSQHQVPPATIYRLLREAVLPNGRPTEVFLYTQPVSPYSYSNRNTSYTQQGIENVQSVSLLLAQWAVKANQVDALLKLLDERQKQPLAQVNCYVIRAQLAAASLKPEGNVALTWFKEKLAKDTLQNTSDLACHAAFPCLKVKVLEEQALQVIEAALQSFIQQANNGATEPAASMQMFLVKHYLSHGKDQQKIKKGIQEYLKIAEKGGRNQDADSWSYQRRGFFIQAARLFAEADMPTDALDLLGQYVDLANKKSRYYYGDDPEFGTSIISLSKYLATKSPAERYELLKTWSFPTATRKSIRWYACYTPFTDAPVAYREPQSLPDGLFCTPWLLIEAAQATGKLDELLQATDLAVKEKVELAEPLALLIRVIKQDPTVPATLQQYLVEAKKQRPKLGENIYQQQNQRDHVPEIVLLHTLLKQPALHQVARSLLPLMHERLQHGQHAVRLQLLERQLQTLKTSGKLVLPKIELGLKHWQTTTSFAVPDSSGETSTWIVHDGMIAHEGNKNSSLFLDRPLVGSFDFTGEVFLGSNTPTLGYAGLEWTLRGTHQQSAASGVNRTDIKVIPGIFSQGEGFYPFKLEVRPQSVRLFLNGRLFHEEKNPAGTSPWLSLQAYYSSGAFRQLKLTGQPSVPQQISLLQKDRMDGWMPSLFNDTQPPRLSIGTETQQWIDEEYAVTAVKKKSGKDAYDWITNDGVLLGRQLETPGNAADPSQILYQRPLQPGDSIHYEFYYDPAQKYEVHPSLGRIAFVMQPEGVKLVWLDEQLNNGKESLLAGITDPKVSTPGKLPLKSGEWNKLQLRLEGEQVHLVLNDQPIYQRKHEIEAGTRFGLFHWKQSSRVEVRKVMLQGGWKTTPPPENLIEEPSRSPEVAQLHAALMNEGIMENSIESLLQRAKPLSPAAYLALLRSWVLPESGSVKVRLYAGFASLQAPSAQETTYGEWVCPALVLVEAAKGQNQLNSLLEQVDKLSGKNDYDRRCINAFRLIIKLALGQDIDKEAEVVEKAIAVIDDRVPTRERWPELIAIRAMLDSPVARVQTDKLLDLLVQQYVNLITENIGFADQADWANALLHVRGVSQQRQAPNSKSISARTLAHWAPASHVTAGSLAASKPASQWLQQDSSILHTSSHDDDLLFFRSPLRGDFTVECELPFERFNKSLIQYAGQRLEPQDDLKKYTLYQFGDQERENNFVPKLDKLDKWYRFKLSVKQGNMTTYLNDRKVFEKRLSTDADPWLAIACRAGHLGGIRHLKITGLPEIPNEVELSKSKSLQDWVPSYFGEIIIKRNNDGGGRYYQQQTTENLGWEKKGEEIVGTVSKKTLGRKSESVLRYHRPMMEDGQLEYEFYYEPGKTQVHPALDRLVFLLDKQDVKVHWLTNAAPDRGQPKPDNANVEPETRRGSGPLPLKPSAWNSMVLTFKGDTVTLLLNGKEIAKRQLNQGNTRHIGLFHYADETNVRVRNVKLRGEWPKQLPAADQLFAPQ